MHKELMDPTLAKAWEDTSTMKYLTCRHHPGARYLTKNPWTRSIHFVEADLLMVIEWCERDGGESPTLELAAALALTPTPSMECPCPFSDLVFVPQD